MPPTVRVSLLGRHEITSSRQCLRKESRPMTDDTSASRSEESPTAPLPQATNGPAESTVASASETPTEPITAEATTASTEPFPAVPAQTPESGVVSALHHANPSTVVAIIAGAFVIAALAFGGGWMSRGFVDHTPLGHGVGFSALGNLQGPNAGPGSQEYRGTPDGPGRQFYRRGMRGAPGDQGNGSRPGFGWRQAPSRNQTPTVPGAPNQ